MAWFPDLIFSDVKPSLPWELLSPPRRLGGCGPPGPDTCLQR